MTRFCLMTGAALALSALPLGAALRTSAGYSVAAETLDAGGAPALSSLYMQSATFGSLAGTQSSAAYTNISGFLNVGAEPEITVEQPAGTELADGTASVSFGTVTLGSAASRTFTIKNKGTANLTGLTVTIDGAGEEAFSVTTAAAAPVAGPNDATTLVITFSPVTNGDKTAALHLASNDADESPFDISLTGIAQTVGQSWRQQYFGTTVNLGDAADTADPDLDGLTNLQERAIGTNPKAGTAGAASFSGNTIIPGTPAVGMTSTPFGADFQAVFLRRKDYMAAGLTYRVEFSADLGAGSWVATNDTPTVLADDGILQVVAVPYPLSIEGRKPQFFRVAVTEH